MFKILFTISYDGTDYFGWQRQPNQRTVQQTIEDTLFQILQIKTPIQGAGRTDRGVHAKGQVATCTIPESTNLKKLLNSLNALLPNSIRITSLKKASESFHPRYSAKGKKYCYRVFTGPHLDPFLRHSHYHHPYKLDLETLSSAIPLLLGKRDFSSFANLPGKNCKTPSPIKHLYDIKLKTHPQGFTLTFHGDGFLYKMVRNLTGALLDVAGKKITPADLKAILEKKQNTHGLFQAPAVGLCLEQVEYQPEFL